ncbi:Protein SAAL1-like [Oopsacas minuta]|uniref:Protein SAAL1-like n=1 Tax=Oopsacas minuta TaxID=111878 RepID=A0AAV7JM08_9METZ|nr:Protein SAAL1-like [Oopsacas minuta]
MADLIRNPSPPHQAKTDSTELKQLLQTQADDVIMDTLFSKSWLITTMNRVVQYVQKGLIQYPIASAKPIIVDLTDSSPETGVVSSPKRAKLNTENDTAVELLDCKDNGETKDSTNPIQKPSIDNSTDLTDKKGGGDTTSTAATLSDTTNSNRLVLELDAELEKEFCNLWDATVNQHVAVFFSENNLIPILIHTVCNSRYPRLNEMCMGVLANIACNTNIAEKEFSSPHIAWFSCNMLTCDDPQTLMETLRLIETCVTDESTQEVWCNVFEDQKVIDTVQFIFDSSTNTELLFSLSRLVDLLLDLWSPLLYKFSTVEMTYALFEAHSQIMHPSLETAVNIIMIIHQLSTADEGVQVLLKLHTTMVDSCSNHIMILHEELGPQLAFSDASYRAAVALLQITVDSMKIKLGTLLMEDGKDFLAVLGDIYQKNVKLYCKEEMPAKSKSPSVTKSPLINQTTENCEQLELLEKTHLLEQNI